MKTTLALLALPFLSAAPLVAQSDPAGPGQDLLELFDKMHREGASEDQLRKLLSDRSDKSLLVEPKAPYLDEMPRPDHPSLVQESPTWRIGLMVEPLPPFVREHFGLDKNEGVRVAEVAGGSPAHRLGIQSNDIILSAGDKKVSDLEGLKNLVERAGREGKSLKLAWIHKGERKSAEVQPEGPPPQEAGREEREVRDGDAPQRPAMMRRMEEMGRQMARQQREIEQLRREIEKLKRESRDDEE